MWHKVVKWGRLALRVFLIGSLIVKVVLLFIEPSVALAASPPWTITTHFHEIDSVHSVPHNGIDFAVPEGTPIHSVTDGTVEIVRDEGNISFGRSVRIRTADGRLVIYGHLHDWAVRRGMQVHFGDVLGHSGNTGHSTGPHLHFQVNINGRAIDPEPTIMEGVMRKAGDKFVYKP